MDQNQKNNKVVLKKIIKVVFLISIVIFLVSFLGGAIYQISSQNILQEKTAEFAIESKAVEDANQNIVSVFLDKDKPKMNIAFQNLLTATQKLQPKIDEVLNLVQQNPNNFSSKNDIMAIKGMEIQDLYNKKLTEEATFALTIDWVIGATKDQQDKFNQILNQLLDIRRELNFIHSIPRTN